MAVLGLCFAAGFSLLATSGGYSVLGVSGLLAAVASLVVEPGLRACGFQQLWHVGSVVAAPRLLSIDSIIVAHGLSSCSASGIFLDQGSSPCLLHWQVDSLPPSHRGSLHIFVSCLFWCEYLSSTLKKFQLYTLL